MTYRGRFAPSPTGQLHFGSLVAAVGSWLHARHAGGQWLVRMEDIDPPREVAGAAAGILAALPEFGRVADGPPLFQSQRTAAYEAAFEQLRAADLVFPCTCSRSQLAVSGGIHRAGLCVAAQQNFHTNLGAVGRDSSASSRSQHGLRPGEEFDVDDGSVVIAAITSCTNTSNPAVMLGAGLLAKKAAALGLKSKPWVKTSLAPGSKVVTDYLEKTGLLSELDKLGFYLVGYGCTTCIGNSGPLPNDISKAITDGDLTAAAVISGNRNFEGRVHAEVKMNYLASPPLVVAYALAGTLDIDLTTQPLGQGKDGKDVYLKDIWPSNKEISDLMAGAVTSEMFRKNYADVFKGDERWNAIASPDGALYEWDKDSTYIKNPPYFDGMTMELTPVKDIHDARCIGLFGDSITTDHISPAGSIKKDSPAGRFLISRGVKPIDFNSYGSRRGNDDVMVRGTFANIRIRNQLLDGVEGGFTRHIPSGEQMSIYDAAMKYKDEGTPLVVFAGKEYGTGSSRDWAAKGTLLLGIKAVVAESFERIHRSNLVGMGVLPLQFKAGENAKSLGLTGKETFSISGLDDGKAKQASVSGDPPAGRRVVLGPAVAQGVQLGLDTFVDLVRGP